MSQMSCGTKGLRLLQKLMKSRHVLWAEFAASRIYIRLELGLRWKTECLFLFPPKKERPQGQSDDREGRQKSFILRLPKAVGSFRHF